MVRWYDEMLSVPVSFAKIKLKTVIPLMRSLCNMKIQSGTYQLLVMWRVC
jgi:hypothetical protein